MQHLPFHPYRGICVDDMKFCPNCFSRSLLINPNSFLKLDFCHKCFGFNLKQALSFEQMNIISKNNQKNIKRKINLKQKIKLFFHLL